MSLEPSYSGHHDAIILFSFRRPAMTAAALGRLVSAAPAARIFVSIDGIAPWSSELDQVLRKQTVQEVESFAARFPNVEPVVWPVGTGLNGHIMRALNLVLAAYHKVVFLEEDHVIGNDGLHFLSRNIRNVSVPQLVVGYSRSSHLGNLQLPRSTAFPSLWGVGMNDVLLEVFQRVVSDGVIQHKVIRESMHQAIPTPILANVAIAYWDRLLNKAILSHSHTDALLVYGLWASQTFALAPWQSLVTDIGHTCEGGLSQRQELKLKSSIHRIRGFNAPTGKACSTCEHFDLFVRLEGALRYKAASLVPGLRPSKPLL